MSEEVFSGTESGHSLCIGPLPPNRGFSWLTPCRTNQPASSRLASGQQRTPTWQKKTPTSQQKCAGTPKTASPMANPLQMMTQNMPEAFSSTRVSFIPNLYSENMMVKLINVFRMLSIPGPLNPSTLTKFNSWFSDVDQIARLAENVEGSPLIPVTDIVTLNSLRLEQKKMGKGLVNLDDFFVDYTQATFACLGLCIWRLNLDDLPQFLYNKACRQPTLKLVWKAAVCVAYTYMNISKKYKEDLELLIPTEKKQVEKLCEDKDCNFIGRVIEHLLEDRSCSETSKTISKDNIQCQCSQKQQIKFCKSCIHNQNPQVPIRKHHQGLPLNFYDPNWFNNLLTQQRIDVDDTQTIAFLPDASKLLQGNKLPAEKLLEKQFTKNYLNQLPAPWTSLMKSKTRSRRIHQTLRMIAAIVLMRTLSTMKIKVKGVVMMKMIKMWHKREDTMP
ncbi:hypothetical protein VP01_7g14 [Puccinia sorghi]|uniref:Uncharacterized protein n=1 Tax=Puccinia sorghi TaxID=27349 RepID=A0A0L6UAK4_9BASI|nr:hypothetical protein VP01_7g14 [Puccinia sorghi]